MRPALAFALAVAFALVAPLAPAHAGAATTEVTLVVDGEPAHGWIAHPTAACRGVVVLAHGYGHSAGDHRGHLQHLADQGFVAIAMDYRGDISGFPLANGAADTVAATRFAKAQCPGQPAHFFSVSMGTAVAAMALPRLQGEFVDWVDSEGLAMLAETWAEAKAVCPGVPFGCAAAEAIEAEAGGTPAEAPDAYVARSAALRASEMAGLRGVLVLHDVNDGLVGANQGPEMAAALRAAGVPTDLYEVLRGEPGGEGTSLTGYAGVQVDGLAGHGDESDDGDTMTRLAFALLDRVVTGDYGQAGNGTFVVDRETGTLP